MGRGDCVQLPYPVRSGSALTPNLISIKGLRPDTIELVTFAMAIIWYCEFHNLTTSDPMLYSMSITIYVLHKDRGCRMQDRGCHHKDCIDKRDCIIKGTVATFSRLILLPGLPAPTSFITSDILTSY